MPGINSPIFTQDCVAKHAYMEEPAVHRNKLRQNINGCHLHKSKLPFALLSVSKQCHNKSMGPCNLFVRLYIGRQLHCPENMHSGTSSCSSLYLKSTSI